MHTQINIRVCKYTCLCVYVQTNTHVYAHSNTHTCMYIHLCVGGCVVQTHTHLYVQTYIYTNVHTHIHTCMYTHWCAYFCTYNVWMLIWVYVCVIHTNTHPYIWLYTYKKIHGHADIFIHDNRGLFNGCYGLKVQLVDIYECTSIHFHSIMQKKLVFRKN